MVLSPVFTDEVKGYETINQDVHSAQPPSFITTNATALVDKYPLYCADVSEPSNC
jgi:hypothetical protein